MDIIRTTIPGVSLIRSDHNAQAVHCTLEPALWIVIQGTTSAVVDEVSYECQAGEAFFTTDKLPSSYTSRVAGETKPFLGLVIELTNDFTRELAAMPDLLLAVPKGRKSDVEVLKLIPELQDCVLRLGKLLQLPEAVPTLYPGLLREVAYWLLRSPSGRRILGMLTPLGHDQRVVRALKYLQESFRNAICVERLAVDFGMSPTSFHRHFKEVTTVSPLQYLKRLRLLEARRLLVAGNLNVKSVAFTVGYISSSHFSQEYVKMFGKPPRQHLLTRDRSQTGSLGWNFSALEQRALGRENGSDWRGAAQVNAIGPAEGL